MQIFLGQHGSSDSCITPCPEHLFLSSVPLGQINTKSESGNQFPLLGQKPRWKQPRAMPGGAERKELTNEPQACGSWHDLQVESAQINGVRRHPAGVPGAQVLIPQWGDPGPF